MSSLAQVVELWDVDLVECNTCYFVLLLILRGEAIDCYTQWLCPLSAGEDEEVDVSPQHFVGF